MRAESTAALSWLRNGFKAKQNTENKTAFGSQVQGEKKKQNSQQIKPQPTCEAIKIPPPKLSCELVNIMISTSWFAELLSCHRSGLMSITQRGPLPGNDGRQPRPSPANHGGTQSCFPPPGAHAALRMLKAAGMLGRGTGKPPGGSKPENGTQLFVLSHEPLSQTHNSLC